MTYHVISCYVALYCIPSYYISCGCNGHGDGGGSAARRDVALGMTSRDATPQGIGSFKNV